MQPRSFLLWNALMTTIAIGLVLLIPDVFSRISLGLFWWAMVIAPLFFQRRKMMMYYIDSGLALAKTPTEKEILLQWIATNAANVEQ